MSGERHCTPVPAGTQPAAHQLAGAAAPPAATTEPQAALPPRHPPIGDRSCAIMCTSGAGGQRGPRCQLGARTRRGRLPQRAQMPAPARPQHQCALTRTRSAHLHSSSQPPHRPTARPQLQPPATMRAAIALLLLSAACMASAYRVTLNR